MRALWALLAAAAAFQPPAPAPPVFTPDTVVRVDATAVDARGRFVASLTARDFELREDGVVQTIDHVRLVSAADGGGDGAAPLQAITSDDEEQAEARRPGARLFAIYLDEYQIAGDAVDRVRAALTRFVDEAIGPRDLVVVMRPLDSILSIRLSHDREAARAAIAALAGRKGDYEPRNGYEKNFMGTNVAAIDQTRTQVTLSALNALAVHLGWASPDARKTLIVVSEGFTRGIRRRGLSLPTLDAVVRSANRHNVAVYPIDPQEADATDTAAGDSLRTLASETDGRAVLTSGDLTPVFARIVDDASAYYLITYRSQKKIDGHFHELKVRVKRPGVSVRTRRGYWATSADELLRAEWLAADARPKKTLAPEPPRHISALIRPWFGLSRGEGGKTRVTFVWEPVRAVGDRLRRAPARIELTALGEGDEAPVFKGPVRPTGAAAAETPDVDPLRAVFDVPPGTLRIRMAIEDLSQQVLDSDVRQIAIRDLSKGVVLGSPEVMRARNARDFRELLADPASPPVAAREFSRTERLLIRVPAYSADGGTPRVSARLLSRGGQAMRELPVQPAPSSHDVYQIDLPLAGLAAGDYILELAASTASGEVKDLMNFRVTS
jgi:VWFA-related protein